MRREEDGKMYVHDTDGKMLVNNLVMVETVMVVIVIVMLVMLARVMVMIVNLF